MEASDAVTVPSPSPKIAPAAIVRNDAGSSSTQATT